MSNNLLNHSEMLDILGTHFSIRGGMPLDRKVDFYVYQIVIDVPTAFGLAQFNASLW